MIGHRIVAFIMELVYAATLTKMTSGRSDPRWFIWTVGIIEVARLLEDLDG